MRTEAEIKMIRDSVQAKLIAKQRLTGLALELTPDGFVEDNDNWLTVIVTPSKSDIRVYDYVEALGEVEQGLREEGFRQAVVLPSMGD